MKSIVYLAVPYSDPSKNVRLYRFQMANKVAAKLMREGMHIFSPISHTHPIALAGDLPLAWDYWKAYDEAILSCCERLIVLKLSGWKKSKGIAGEIEIAKKLGIEVVFMNAPRKRRILLSIAQQTACEVRPPLK